MNRVDIDQEALARLFNDPKGPVGRDLKRRGSNVEFLAKQLVPVDTGLLRASITSSLGHDEHGLFAGIGSDVDYAIYVEYGTGRQSTWPGDKNTSINGMAPQPYLRPALKAAGK